VSAELIALREDVDSLTGELLNRYEEITLLYDLAREMGVVVDLEEASQTALERSLQIIPARLGLVLVGNDPDQLRTVASYGSTGPDESRIRQVREAACEAMHSGSQVMVEAGAPAYDGGRLSEPVLVAPLTTAGTSVAEQRMAGVIALVGHEHSDRFSAAEVQLCAVVAGQLGQGVENARVISQLREKERLESDLTAAAGIQRSLLPPHPPRLLNATLAAECLPAAQVGGDYFDFVLDANGGVNIVVADVTGHGLGPGLIMAMTRSALRAELRRRGSLSEALQATNAVMWDDLVATEAFITVFAARYEPETRGLTYVNAGHQPALLHRADGSADELNSEGMPFGIVPSPEYEENTRQLAPGDVVLMFSDGVVEASSPDGLPYGTAGLQAVIAHVTRSASDLVTRVLADLADFQGSCMQQDDVTVVALQVTDRNEVGG
jgi:serine phosphatase RsbU (regulator of sigma subunit)